MADQFIQIAEDPDWLREVAPITDPSDIEWIKRELQKDAPYHLDGIPWYDAPRPFWLHRCKVQTYGYVGMFDYVERCACGAIRRGGTRFWFERNSRRRGGRPVADIVEFLTARIAEDERRAEGSGTVAWLTFRDSDGGMRYTTVAASDGVGGWLIDGEQAEGWTDCTVIYSESQRLAECAAKREIIKLHEEWPVLVERDPSVDLSAVEDSMIFRMSRQIAWLTEREYVTRFGTEPPTAPTISALAAVYKDHPDYQQEWSRG